MRAQINGILHEDSLPFYDQVAPPSAPSRQGSASLAQLPSHTTPTHNTSPRFRTSQMQHGTGPTRLSTQGSQIDLGDLGVSSPSGQISRTNSRDTGHIATLAPTQHASGSWQGRLSRVSMDSQQSQSHRQHLPTHLAPAQRSSAAQGSAYASLESMLSSIPETLSSKPSMPSMPSVPSMSDIERSMQSGWSSFTGSLGLSPSPAQPQQQPPAPAGWVAFADDASTLPANTAPAQTSARGMPSNSQPAQPSNIVAPQLGSMLLPGTTCAVSPSDVSVRASDGNAGSTGGHTPLASPCKKPTGLQALDPLTAAKEAASVPLRAMSSFRQDSSGTSSLKASTGMPATQASSDRGGIAAQPQEASLPAVDVCLSSDWSEFAAAQAADPAAMQPLPREVARASNAVQSIDKRANTDVWAQWSMPANVLAQPNNAAYDTPNVSIASAAAADHHSLLDM